MHPDTHTRPAPGVGPRWNALKHGYHAESVVLPGEDPTPFLCHRRALFHTYRPQTPDEAELVGAMARHQWIAHRLCAAQALFDAQWVAPEQDATGRVCEPISHQREHSAIDVNIRWKRVEGMGHGARSRLLLLQRLRQQGLVPGAVKLPKDCYLDTDGAVYGPVVVREVVPLPEPPLGAETDSATPSADRPVGFSTEQQETGRREGREAASPGHADAAPAGTEPPRTASGARWTGGFGVPGVSVEAPGTAAAGV